VLQGDRFWAATSARGLAAIASDRDSAFVYGHTGAQLYPGAQVRF
jgi:hypothetical protein